MKVWSRIEVCRRSLFAGLFLAAGRLPAQTDSQYVLPMGAILPADIAHDISVIADDSVKGRTTPSPALEKTARYVAERFKSAGLEPAATDTGGWFQRYFAGDLMVDYDRSNMAFLAKITRQGRQVVGEEGWLLMRPVRLAWAADIAFAVDTVLDCRAPEANSGGQAVAIDFGRLGGASEYLIAGPHTAASLRRADLRNKVVFYLPSPGTGTDTQRQIVDLLRSFSNNVLIISDEDSSTFAGRHAAALRAPPVVPDPSAAVSQQPLRWAVYVRHDAIKSAMAGAGIDLDEVRRSSDPVVREVATFIALEAWGKPTEGAITAPNTVGMLRAENPKSGVVIITAHMDQADSGQAGHGNGADDNASGVVGLIALANAFRQAGPMQRSIVFAAVSGSRDSRGSTALAGDLARRYRTGVNINLDMIGRKAGDSIRVAGLRDATFPTRPEWLAAQHPELGLTVVDGGTVVAPEFDHFAFVRHVMPSLYFYNGTHGERSAGTTPDAIDADQEARILGLVFYLGRDIANAGRFPEWTEEGRRQRLRAFASTP